jgi:hypothetical protein
VPWLIEASPRAKKLSPRKTRSAARSAQSSLFDALFMFPPKTFTQRIKKSLMILSLLFGVIVAMTENTPTIETATCKIPAQSSAFNVSKKSISFSFFFSFQRAVRPLRLVDRVRSSNRSIHPAVPSCDILDS